MWRKTTKWLPQVNRPSTGKAVLIAALMLPGVNLVISFFQGIVTPPNFNDDYLQMMASLFTGPLWLQILCIAILGPILEELCFRGIILNRALYSMPKWAAVILSSALFGIAHFQLVQGICAALLGVCLALLYVKYRSLWVTIAAHVAINLISVILNQFNFKNGEMIQASDTTTLLLVVSEILLIALAIIVFFALHRKASAATFVAEPDVDGMFSAPVSLTYGYASPYNTLPPLPQPGNAQFGQYPPQNGNAQSGQYPPPQNGNAQFGQYPPPQNGNAQPGQYPPPQNGNAQPGQYPPPQVDVTPFDATPEQETPDRRETLRVKDLEASVKFYRETVGLVLKSWKPSGFVAASEVTSAILGGNDLELELVRAESTEQLPPVTLKLPPAATEEAVGGSGVSELRDPDGNTIVRGE
jgi:membrane protease YdiL (CAAX protease family)